MITFFDRVVSRSLRWSVVSGQWSVVGGHWSLVIGHWLLVQMTTNN